MGEIALVVVTSCLILCGVGCAGQGASNNTGNDAGGSQGVDSQSLADNANTEAHSDIETYSDGQISDDGIAYVNQSCGFIYGIPDGYRPAAKEDADIALVNESAQMAIEFLYLGETSVALAVTDAETMYVMAKDKEKQGLLNKVEMGKLDSLITSRNGTAPKLPYQNKILEASVHMLDISSIPVCQSA